MIGSLRDKRRKDLRENREFEREREEILKKSGLLNAKLNLAESEDMERRFGEYNTDPSVGNMYQRKPKKSDPLADASKEYLNGVLNVTKGATIGVLGMGVAGTIGATLARKKKKSNKPKRCSCKKK